MRYDIPAMSICFFNSLPNSEYSNLLIVAAVSNKYSSGKTISPIKNSYLASFPNCIAYILTVSLSKSIEL